jgi:schlafen family protein
MSMDPGRALFERLRAERWKLVREWVDIREAETTHLEFKRKAKHSTAEIDDDDKGGVARTLSAFANTEGGLLVLGIGPGAAVARHSTAPRKWRRSRTSNASAAR